jgi:hypothetical protein
MPSLLSLSWHFHQTLTASNPMNLSEFNSYIQPNCIVVLVVDILTWHSFEENTSSRTLLLLAVLFVHRNNLIDLKIKKQKIKLFLLTQRSESLSDIRYPCPSQ